MTFSAPQLPRLPQNEQGVPNYLNQLNFSLRKQFTDLSRSAAGHYFSSDFSVGSPNYWIPALQGLSVTPTATGAVFTLSQIAFVSFNISWSNAARQTYTLSLPRVSKAITTNIIYAPFTKPNVYIQTDINSSTAKFLQGTSEFNFPVTANIAGSFFYFI